LFFLLILVRESLFDFTLNELIELLLVDRLVLERLLKSFILLSLALDDAVELLELISELLRLLVGEEA